MPTKIRILDSSSSSSSASASAEGEDGGRRSSRPRRAAAAAAASSQLDGDGDVDDALVDSSDDDFDTPGGRGGRGKKRSGGQPKKQKNRRKQQQQKKGVPKEKQKGGPKQASLLNFAAKGVSNTKSDSGSGRGRGGGRGGRRRPAAPSSSSSSEEESSGEEEETAPTRRSTRTRGVVPAGSMAESSDEDGAGDGGGGDDDESAAAADDGSDSDDSDDEPRRRGGTKGAKKKSARPAAAAAVRQSSRSNRFKASMAEPSGKSVADLFRGTDANMRLSPSQKHDDDDEEPQAKSRRKRPPPKPKPSTPPPKKPRAARGGKSQSAAAAATPTPIKSPAVRHKVRRRQAARGGRRSLARLSEEESSSEEEESSSEEEEGGFEYGDEDEEEEEDELKIQRIIASKSLPRGEWRKVCSKMNTSEVDDGSRWFQGDKGGDDGDGDGGGEEDDENAFEERFLVKWADFSYVHCSWESEADLLDQVENAKNYLSTFFRKAVNGCLFSADERGDGEFFDPSFVQIERILDVVEPEMEEEETVGADGDEDGKRGTGKYGMIFDKNHPEYETGTGRQFLVKWEHVPYADCSYEFERDFIMNDIDYEDHVALFLGRRKKPNKAAVMKAEKDGEKERRLLYTVFGDKVKMSDAEREKKVRAYQDELAGRTFKNGGQLRDYQAEGVSWLVSNHVNARSGILADEMGLGKTIQTAVFVDTVSRMLRKRGPFLIVAPLSTIPHWQREFLRWTDLNTIVYHGSAEDREFIRQYEVPFGVDSIDPNELPQNCTYLRRCQAKNKAKWTRTWMAQVVITTPEMLVTDDFKELSEIRWEILVVDEAHRLKNHSSKLANNLRHDKFRFDHILLLTGTPIQNNMNELWTLLHFIDRESFASVDEFLERYGDIKSKERVDELHEQIRPYILRRLKEDVEKSVPPKEETLIEVELTVVQKQYYRALYERNVQFLHRNHKKALDGPSLNNLAMQLRKCCNHAFLLNGVEQEVRSQEEQQSGAPVSDADLLVKASGKLVLLDKLLPRLKEGGHRVLIFSQFKIMLDLLEDYLASRAFKSERIDGSITGLKRQNAIDRFQAEEEEGKTSSFIMLLSTRAGGVGINLTAADTVIIFDSDWNPQNDLQAQARCHRIGQTKNVKVYRLLSRKTYEMQMFHMSSLKMGLDQAVLQGIENKNDGKGEGTLTKEEVEKLLRHGAYDIFNEDKSGKSEAESNEFAAQDIDSILARRAKTVIHDNTGSKSNAAGGTFSKASFKVGSKSTGNSDDVKSTEEVDIDDPEFWKKMVGEAQVEDDKKIIGRKRKRKKTNYSELDYERKLRAQLNTPRTKDSSESDDASVSSAEVETEDSSSDDEYETETTGLGEKRLREPKRERARWGGKKSCEWEKKDVESLVRLLQGFGYNMENIDVLVRGSHFQREYEREEIQRMAWALLLLTLKEAAEEEVLDGAKRAKRALEKKRNPETDLPGEGEGKDVSILPTECDPVPKDKSPLSNLPSEAQSLQKSETKQNEADLEEAFSKLLKKNVGWAKRAFKDAQHYAITHAPRPDHVISEVFQDGDNGGQLHKALPPRTIAFMKNVWPALKSRGWKEDVVVNEASDSNYVGRSSTRYIFGGKTYRSVSLALEAIPQLHPELKNAVESVKDAGNTDKDKGNRPDSPTAIAAAVPAQARGFETLTAESLNLFLRQYAPLQLLADRKGHNKVFLPKKVLSVCSLMEKAYSLVSLASQAYLGTTEDEGDTLAKFMPSIRNANPPHPAWNAQCDATLIRAIIQHGWIDNEKRYRAIAEDESIKWNNANGVVTDSQANDQGDRMKEFLALQATASAAARFLNALGDDAEGLKGFHMELITDTFCLETGDDESWLVNYAMLESSLRHGKNDDFVLPPRVDLLRRAKNILAHFGGSTNPGGQAQGFVNSSELHSNDKEALYTDPLASTVASALGPSSFSVLDQSRRANLLLAEMLRCMVKLGTKGKEKCWRMVASSAEAEALRLASESTDGAIAQIVGHIKLARSAVKAKSAVAAKNVLRVILGMEPVVPKNPNESLFPQLGRKVGMSQSKLTQGHPSSSGSHGFPNSSMDPKKKHKLRSKDTHTLAENAIVRAVRVAFQKENESADSLMLPVVEVTLLSVVSATGIPVWSTEWDTLLYSEDTGFGGSSDFKLTWECVGTVLENGARGDYLTQQERLENLLSKLEHMKQSNADNASHAEKLKKCEEECNLQRSKTEAYRMAVAEITELKKKPLDLAKKTIMLLEALRLKMGPVDANKVSDWKRMKTSSKEHGVGPKILLWTGRELIRWAESLNILVAGKKLPEPWTNCNQETSSGPGGAALDSKACRAIFTQTSQQSRLRSLFAKKNSADLYGYLSKAAKASQRNGDTWSDIPSWWKSSDNSPSSSSDDFDLLAGVLRLSYQGFEVLCSEGRFDQMLKEEGEKENVANGDSNSAVSLFTRASVQPRVNHLTRELSALEDAEDMMRRIDDRNKSSSTANHSQLLSGLRGESRGKKVASIQLGLTSFFKPAQPVQEKVSDVEIISVESTTTSDVSRCKRKSGDEGESIQTGDRKHASGQVYELEVVDLVSSPEKKQRTSIASSESPPSSPSLLSVACTNG